MNKAELSSLSAHTKLMPLWYNMVALLPAWVAGLFLGALFFGGLWWTVRRGLTAKRPGLWFLGSLLLRTMLTMAGFYLVAYGNWQRLLACLVGFGMARLLVTRISRPPIAMSNLSARETSHEA